MSMMKIRTAQTPTTQLGGHLSPLAPRLAAWTMAVALGLGVGCGGPSEDTGAGEEMSGVDEAMEASSAAVTACSATAPCVPGRQCEAGTCVAECSADVECGAGERCFDGSCITQRVFNISTNVQLGGPCATTPTWTISVLTGGVWRTLTSYSSPAATTFPMQISLTDRAATGYSADRVVPQGVDGLRFTRRGDCPVNVGAMSLSTLSKNGASALGTGKTRITTNMNPAYPSYPSTSAGRILPCNMASSTAFYAPNQRVTDRSITMRTSSFINSSNPNAPMAADTVKRCGLINDSTWVGDTGGSATVWIEGYAIH